MTALQSSAAKASVRANNPADDGGDIPHAYVQNGDLFILDGGRYWRFDSLSAWSLWFEAFESPIPSTQERARQIRAAMDEAFPERKAA
jgi:hypothetical protein